MTPRRKPDARGIVRFLSELKKAEWLGTARRWWPDYVFHFTDLQNAVSILKTGALFSRVETQNLGLMDTDNASQEILGSTDNEYKDYVRLYFRPKTPTQFHNEGFRPINQRWQGAHCPVPIYFLFDSRKCSVTNGQPLHGWQFGSKPNAVLRPAGAGADTFRVCLSRFSHPR